jgi:methylmalonyl-CoA mutase C-terminal domain/subunit
VLILEKQRKLRILMGKVGLDGHTTGLFAVSKGLANAGLEVILAGIRLTPEEIAANALQEDVDIVGISILSGAHLSLIPRTIRALKGKGLNDCLILVGGIIPPEDIKKLKDIGVAEVFVPGTSMNSIINFIEAATKIRDDIA